MHAARPIICNEAITASAGMGKTEQLAARYIRLLMVEEDLSSILALTFTRVAAGEMLERIIVLLAEAAVSEEGAQILSQRLGVEPPLTRGRAGELLSRVLAQLPRLRIATLDSFMLHVVRSFALELGWPLTVQPMDEVDEDAVKHRALAEVCAQARGDARLVHAMQQLFTALTEQRAASRVGETLGEACEYPYGVFLRAGGAAEPWHAFPEQKELKNDELEQLCLFQPGLEERINHARYWPSVQRALQSCRKGGWGEVLALTLIQNALAGKKKYGSWEFTPEELEELRGIAVHACGVLLNRARAATAAVYDLLKWYHDALTTLKTARGMCGFDDITRAVCGAAAMLYAQDTELYFRLDGRIRHVLIDEFQDTSWEQWTALQPIADEILCDRSGTRSFFIVGDVKQAIYGWRGGAAELLPRVSEYYAAVMEERVLTESWRAGQKLLDVVNAVFTAESDTDFGKHVAAWREFTHFRPHVSAAPINAARPGYCEIRAVPPDREDSGAEDDDEKPAEAKSGTLCMRSAARFLRAMRPWEYGWKTAVLFRTNVEADAMLTTLRGAGVPCFIQGKSRLFENAAVQAVLALLRWADEPEDKLAALHVRSSFLADSVPADDDAAPAFLAGVRAELLRLTYPVWIEQLVRSALPHLPEEHRQRLLRLVDLAAQYQPRVTPRPGDFVRWLENVRQNEPPASEGVVCTTMHNAKGKTYDVVILPGMEKNPNQQHRVALYLKEQDLGEARAPQVECVLRPPQKEKYVAALNEQFGAMRCAAEKAKWREYLNLMYVALTRASHAMYVFCHEEPNVNTFARWMIDVLRCDDENYTAPEELTDLGDHIYYFIPGGDAGWYKRGRAAVTPRARVQTAGMLADVITHDAVRHRHQVRPSAHAAPADAGVYFRPRAHAAAQRGTALHALFQRVRWLDEKPPREELLNVIRTAAPGLDEAARAEVLAAFDAACARRDVVRVLTRPAEPCEVKTELPFTTLVRGAAVRGVFDRIVCYPSFAAPERIEVFDFKSDAVDSEADIAAREAVYADQMQLYREALHAGYGLPLEKIRTELVFVCRRIANSE